MNKLLKFFLSSAFVANLSMAYASSGTCANLPGTPPAGSCSGATTECDEPMDPQPTSQGECEDNGGDRKSVV